VNHANELLKPSYDLLYISEIGGPVKIWSPPWTHSIISQL